MMPFAIPKAQRFIHQHHSRLVIAIGFGTGIALTLPTVWAVLTRTLIGWNIGVWFYLILMLRLMARANRTQVCKIAQQEYRSRLAELSIMSLAALASLAAIISELSSLKELTTDQRILHYAFTGITVVGSWCLIAVLFTLHYAHLFYTASPGQPTLMFPDKEPNPDYWDFLYFSFTIAVATQTSDVMIMSRDMRKTVMAQSILSFIFNVTIVGLSINIVASLINA